MVVAKCHGTESSELFVAEHPIGAKKRIAFSMAIPIAQNVKNVLIAGQTSGLVDTISIKLTPSSQKVAGEGHGFQHAWGATSAKEETA